MIPLTEDRIRDRAYALWEAEGHPDGRDREHWARAERELTEEMELDVSETEEAERRPAAASGVQLH